MSLIASRTITRQFNRLRQSPSPLPAHTKAYIALALAWAAAFVNVVGWLLLSHVYTAHMTGNTSSFGIDVAERHWTQALHHAWPLLPFLLGLLFSAFTTGLAHRFRWHSSFSVALATEILMLGCLMWFGRRYSVHGELRLPSPFVFYFLLSLPAAAMGMQTVTVTRVAGLRVNTTYLTGSLAKLSEAIVHYAFWFQDRTRGRFRQRICKVLRVTLHQKYAQHACLTAGLWIAYFWGAVSGRCSINTTASTRSSCRAAFSRLLRSSIWYNLSRLRMSPDLGTTISLDFRCKSAPPLRREQSNSLHLRKNTNSTESL